MSEEAEKIAMVIGAVGALLAYVNSSKRDTLPGNAMRILTALAVGAFLGACVYGFFGGFDPGR